VRVRLRLDAVPPGLLDDLAGWGERLVQVNGREVALTLPDESRLPELNAWLVGQGMRVYALSPTHLSLEELFVQIMEDQAAEEEPVR
jgi:hypothetical protein